MKKQSKLNLLPLTGMCVLPLWAMSDSAMGQQARLEEIIVTANRREESLQDVPIAISAISEAEIAAQGINNLQDIAASVPGFTSSVAAGANSFFIRGVGSPSSSINSEPSVATYVDDVYIPSGMSTNFELNNVERVEVLKGPQGTLFGRNATGGLVHVFTKNPTHEPELSMSVGVESYDTVNADLYANTSLTDTLAANIALNYKDRDDGWGDNIATGNPAHTEESKSARAKLLWTPNDRTSARLTIAYDWINTGLPYARAPIKGTVVSNPPGPPVGNVGFHDTNLTIDSFHEREIYSYSLKVDHDFNAVSLTSITAYSEMTTDSLYDLDISPFFATQTGLDGDNDMFSQELQLKSNTDSSLQWIVGGFFMKGTSGYQPVTINVRNGATIQQIYSDIDTDSIAGFAQVSWEFMEGTTLTAGARYTRDELTITGATAVNGTLIPSTVLENDESWSEATWRLALDHIVSDKLMVYASINTGYKSGVYNLISYSQEPVEPEKITAYEIGFKSEWLDNRIRLNGSIFYYDYENLQVTVVVDGPSGTPTSFLENAAEATIRGADFELNALLTDNLTIAGGLSFVDGEFDSYPNGNHFSPLPTNTCDPVPYPPNTPGGQVSVSGCDLSGNDIVHAPDATQSLRARYRIPTDMGEFGLSISYYHTSKWYLEGDYSVVNDAYELVNASIDWTSLNGRWSAQIFGKNLTDSEYFISGASTSSGRYYVAGAPTTYGATIRVNF